MEVSPLPAQDVRLEGANDEAVVLVHGWTGHPLHWRPIATILNGAGYTVVAPLIAGHGATVEKFDNSTPSEWIDSVERSISTVADRRRIHLAGLSMGGAISILLAGSTAAATITTINTPVLVRNPRIYTAPILGLFRDRVSLEPSPPPDPGLPTVWDGYESVDIRSVNRLLAITVRAYRAARRLRRPSLVIQSRTDLTVYPRSGPVLASALGARLVWLDDASHNAIIDTSRFQIADLILECITTPQQ